jgi:hypothetical protein
MRLVKVGALAAVAVLLMSGVAHAGAQNVAAEAGIAETFRTFSVTPGDFDRNGDQDFFLVRHIGNEGQANVPESTLYRGAGRQFQNHITSGFGKTDKHGCDWGDANNDGRPDLFCTVGFTQNSENELWIQNSDGSFTNRARALGLTVETFGRYRYGTFIDANGDGRLDIYAARYTGSCFCDNNGDGVVDYAGDSHPNELWLQRTDGTFRHAPEFGLDQPIGAKKDNATCAQAVDYDRDGDQDLLVCGWKKLKLYQNNGGTAGFSDVTTARGITGDARDARLVDLNGDAARDLVKLNATDLTVRYGNGSGGFGPANVILSGLSAPEGLAFGDFDGNGTLDIYQLSGKAGSRPDQPDRIVLNNGTTGSGAYTVDAVIPGSGGDGDDVAAIDWDDNNDVEFVVTNGDKTRAGPVQLFNHTS